MKTVEELNVCFALTDGVKNGEPQVEKVDWATNQQISNDAYHLL